MKDPQKPIIQAVYAALDGLALPVYLTLPLGKDEYVLISQPTLVAGRGSAACVAWDATLLLSVYTKFKRGMADTEPALDVSGELMERLLDQRLDLGEFSMSPIEVQRLSMPHRFDDLHEYVQDNLRLRFEVYAEPTVVVPIKQLSDYTPAELLAGYPNLAALGPLNCPVVQNKHNIVVTFKEDSESDYQILVDQDTAGTYTGFHATQGPVAASYTHGGQTFSLYEASEFTLAVGDTLHLRRESGYLKVTFTGK